MRINGAKLKQARESAGLTRSDLAVIADVTQVRIWQMESRPESNVNENVVKAIAKRLKVDVKEIQAA